MALHSLFHKVPSHCVSRVSIRQFSGFHMSWFKAKLQKSMPDSPLLVAENEMSEKSLHIDIVSDVV